MLEIFETSRPHLWNIAYRMLGSIADAEDAVQDTYLKWQNTNHSDIDNPVAWLVKICTHRCIDIQRSAKASRLEYVGMWLPEPVLSSDIPDQSDTAELASSLTTAFMLLLERLSPIERATYLLREIFEYSYADIAIILGKTEPACRQILSRSKKRIQKKRVNTPINTEHHKMLLHQFLNALQTGRAEKLEQILAEDVKLWGDGGGKVVATLRVIETSHNVASFLVHVWSHNWHEQQFGFTTISGSPGLLMKMNGKLTAAITISLTDDHLLSQIFIVRNPDKLIHISDTVT